MTITLTFLLLASSVISQCYGVADRCTTTNCLLNDGCRCSSATSPLSDGTTPQFISITVDEAVTDLAYNNYWDPIFAGRTNPDGAPIKITYFVPHEYTDYSRVNQLYLSGNEIAVGTITLTSQQDYWRQAPLQTLIDEFRGQKQILNTLANIPLSDIVGGRTPQFQLEGDVSIEAYQASDLIYDSSWPTLSTAPLFPYTLDFLSTQKCDTSASGICPEDAHPGFWEIPIVNLVGTSGTECNALTSCIDFTNSAQDITEYLINQVESVRSTRRTPITIVLSSSSFSSDGSNGFQAFQDFLDHLATLNDVFLVSQSDLIAWTRNPVAVEQYRTPVVDRVAECTIVNCPLETCSSGTRYVRACNSCPEVYPWIGNPEGSRDGACSSSTAPTTPTTPTTSSDITTTTPTTTPTSPTTSPSPTPE